jgi:hypothetical protein
MISFQIELDKQLRTSTSICSDGVKIKLRDSELLQLLNEIFDKRPDMISESAIGDYYQGEKLELESTIDELEECIKELQKEDNNW